MEYNFVYFITHFLLFQHRSNIIIHRHCSFKEIEFSQRIRHPSAIGDI